MSYLTMVVRAARLRREPYLRQVLAPDGVADGAMIVGVVYLALAIPAFVRGVDIIPILRFMLGGLFGWIILSGLVYLIGKHGLEGYGSFQGVMAASALAFPPLVIGVVIEFLLDPLPSSLIASVWLLFCLWMAAKVALDLSNDRAALATIGGYLAWLLVRLIFRF
jgi:hypothetical protein